MVTLTLGHSPDPDDAFMFYALARGLIPTPGLQFSQVLEDIQTLNERATRGELDITAISFHAYAYVADQYALLPCGASMGDGYGPLLIARTRLAREQVVQARIAVPGRLTSAFLALQLWLGKPAADLDVLVVPFDQVFRVVQEGQADAGLIIHEGQLTYGDYGLQACVDLGAWWSQQTGGLPLPLGGNVIHKRHPPELRRQVACLLAASIRYSLEHRAEAVQYALEFGRGLDAQRGDRFVGMYVNHWTLDYGPKGREAIRQFLGQAFQQKLIPQAPALEFVD
jgi:1,4-dihydroxy-6-naphthoate synthase